MSFCFINNLFINDSTDLERKKKANPKMINIY